MFLWKLTEVDFDTEEGLVTRKFSVTCKDPLDRTKYGKSLSKINDPPQNFKGQ